MRSRLGRIAASLTAGLVLVTAAGCTRQAMAGDPAPGGPGGPETATQDRDVAVYTQVLRRYLSTPGENSFPERTFRHVYVLDRAVPDAGDPQARQVAGEPIPAGTQRAVAGALADVGPVTFVADRESVTVLENGCAVVRDGGILVTLGPVDGDGDRAEVGVYGFVACLGATWLTYVVRHTAGAGWQVTGTTGPMAIS